MHDSYRGEHIPSQAEIRQECRRIQAEWSPWERYLRSGKRDIDALREAEKSDGSRATLDDFCKWQPPKAGIEPAEVTYQE